MNTFELHRDIITDYKDYIYSFINIQDKRIGDYVKNKFKDQSFLPEPLIQFNPAYEKGKKLNQLIKEGNVHPELDNIFKGFELYKHQEEAIKLGSELKGFVVTSGTGSGKSLTYLSSIFNFILNNPDKKGIKAVIVYPMNALINSQEEEIHKYRINYLSSFLPAGMEWNQSLHLEDQIKELEGKVKQRFPISYGKYTGQESKDKRERLKKDEPDIILTNYMMLELIMTRNAESSIRRSICDSLQFLVFDELHTYKGRQGADVAMLIRRIQALSTNKSLTFIGTSATMASGSKEKQSNVIADFATNIFGSQFLENQIITESLVFSTDDAIEIAKEDLKSIINKKEEYPLDEGAFKSNSLAVWLEMDFALLKQEDGLIGRRKPTTLKNIIEKLTELTQEKAERCETAVMKVLLWGERLNIEANRRRERKSFLPFKIHQFISQTGTVYTSLEDSEERHITLEEERYVEKDGKNKFLYPLLFSRYSGHEFVCVELDFKQFQVKPRQVDDLGESLTHTDFKEQKSAGLEPTINQLNKGYILFEYPDQEIWSEELIEDFPGSWYKKKADGTYKISKYHSLFIPRKIYFDSDGNFSFESTELPCQGWYLPTRILFDPTAGIIYDSKTAENTKLMRLGNEGRSTATTITAINVIKAMQKQEVEYKNQKLLSFTDNRQDASLQAGHFNDFVTVVRLRSAIYHALKNNVNHQLDITSIAQEVKKELDLKEYEFARRPTEDEQVPNQTNQNALTDYLFVKILNDLKRGWRYILPNLELSGLLEFKYEGLEELAKDQKLLGGDRIFSHLSDEDKFDVLYQILNYFRQGYAIDHKFFDVEELERKEKLIKDNLDENKLWSLDTSEKIERPNALFIKPIPEKFKRQRIFYSSAGPQSNFGKYLKKLITKLEGHDVNQKELADYIEQLLSKLVKYHFLVTNVLKDGDEKHIGYQLNTQKLLWSLGSGNKVIRDEINYNFYKEVNLQPNSFFQKFYQLNFKQFESKLIAREHTGQIDKDTRIEREKDFRKGRISSLFCSPTMELGIDISELNVVHMRNVPPNPANYAQRSGRAGRSGQTALVLNYCSLGSPHDRHYFHHSSEMVAGVVVPPKIDLLNKELIQAHINAYLFMEMHFEDVEGNVGDMLEIGNRADNFPMKSSISDLIKDQIANRKIELLNRIQSALANIKEGLVKTGWYSDKWVIDCVDKFYFNLDKSFDRWRLLFSSAEEQEDRSYKVSKDRTLREDHPDKVEARRLSFWAGKQIELLLNQDDSVTGNSEFYLFRYLASEGFFPGYNFTRLPIRSFLGNRNEGGTFVSRPRFMALREFGPGNIIYHNGGKFRTSNLMLGSSPLENLKRKIKICKESGYAFLDNEGNTVNNDPITNQPLDGGDRVEINTDLVELTETISRPQDRISSHEEERMRMGYEIGLYYNFPKGIESASKTIIKNNGDDLINMWFCRSANIIQVNRKWRYSNQDGYLVDKKNGKFEQLRNSGADVERIKLFAADTSDILLIQPVDVLQLDYSGIVSLAFALKRAIERKYQVEENEIGIEIIGSHDVKNIMIYESSEGSLGILSQISEERDALKKIFVEAYKVCHFDPITRTDTKKDEIGPASYKDLLSYYNQIYHDSLDRSTIKVALERLMDCVHDTTQGFNSREEHLKYLNEHCDPNSKLEKKFIDELEDWECQLPDKAQVNLSSIAHTYASADFMYTKENAVVLVDGSVHDQPNVMMEDEVKRRALRNAGFTVLVYKYSEPIQDFLIRYNHIFKSKKLANVGSI